MGTKHEENIKQGLSKREALALTRLAAQNETVISLEDIQSSIDTSYDEAKKIAHNLVEKRWLDRLKRGVYLIVPLSAGESGEYTEHEYIIASHLADPMYVSYWSALNYHGFTEQIPMTVFAATLEKVPERTIHGVTYRFVTLSESKFFGYEQRAVSSQTVNIATVEKTLVDCADHPEHCGGIRELAKGFARATDIDTDRLVAFLRRLDNGAATKRVVYLADLLDVSLPERETLTAEFTTGYSKLDPTRDADGNYSSEYRLQLNVPESELLNAVATER